ncbi:hypothetical protein [Chengkuizengella sediminis]|uniref:hypothetical protein n=1 Tax=Chengkuizengella sediminis TaxID=1885917 RepID=UPI001389BCE8|nr:hypothetical protein [Chengkuizengella sediminis]NDI36619.1 hypothetical protein [Chengkuizengella sediminis]
MSEIILPITSTSINQNNKSINLPNKTKSEVKNRKSRSDKLFPRKFPVSDEMRKEIRKWFIVYKKVCRTESITEFNTMLLRFGFRNLDILRNDFKYVDSGIYKTVKPNKLEKSYITDIGGLVDEWGVSERKAIHQIICSVLVYLQNGGGLTYEEIQPIKLHK